MRGWGRDFLGNGAREKGREGAEGVDVDNAPSSRTRDLMMSIEPSSGDKAKESPMQIDEAVAGEALAVVERYITAINAGDGSGVQDALNFPHFRVGAQGRVTYYPDQSSDHLANFRKRTQADGWNRSEIDRMEVIYTQADKAHLLLWFRRLRADGSLIGAYHSLYIITEVGGHWGIQGGSGSGF